MKLIVVSRASRRLYATGYVSRHCAVARAEADGAAAGAGAVECGCVSCTLRGYGEPRIW